MKLWQHYHLPKSVDEALQLLEHYEGGARVISGGTDLLLDMQQGRTQAVHAMIDVTAIDGMDQIREKDGMIVVGAAVTHSAIVRSDLLTQQATCLVESCGVIGGPQVRNVATLGGNVAHALPAADGTTALVALAGEAEVAAAGSRSWRPVLSLFKGPGVSAVDHNRQLLTRFRFAASGPGVGTAFKRIMRPQGVALPILACAAWVKIKEPEAEIEAGEATIDEARICVGPVRPVPARAGQAEAALRGRTLAEALADCVAAAQAEFSPRTSKYRATSEYRVEMIEVLLRRSLPLAVRRAIEGEAIPEGVGLQ